MSSLQTARFASEKGWQRDLSACQRATARALASSSFSPDLSQLVRRVDSPSSHTSRPPAKKADFTRNRTRPTTKSHPFPLPKTHTKATGDDGGDFRCAEKKKGEIRPAGTISREGMRARISRQMVMDQMYWKEYTRQPFEWQERQMVNHPGTQLSPSLMFSDMSWKSFLWQSEHHQSNKTG